MSARIELKPVSWHPLPPTQVEITAKQINDMQLETLTNLDRSSGIPALPDLQRKPDARATSEAKHRTESGREADRNTRLIQREMLHSQIKRGEEYLEQVRKELAAVRADLEQWTEYERICGRNPLADYLQSISTKEQIAKFLPGWLKRQREQLQSLSRKMGAPGRKAA